MSAPPTGGLKQLRLVSTLFRLPCPSLIVLSSPPSLIRDLPCCPPTRQALHLAFCLVSMLGSSITSQPDENHFKVDHLFNTSTPRSPSVSSTTSFSHNSLVCCCFFSLAVREFTSNSFRFHVHKYPSKHIIPYSAPSPIPPSCKPPIMLILRHSYPPLVMICDPFVYLFSSQGPGVYRTTEQVLEIILQLIMPFVYLGGLRC